MCPFFILLHYSLCIIRLYSTIPTFIAKGTLTRVKSEAGDEKLVVEETKVQAIQQGEISNNGNLPCFFDR